MTALKTRTELSKEFKNVKYILTSSMRTRILLAIYNDSKNLDDLRQDLNKPSATILHGLKELETENFVRKVQKHYELTSNGYLLTTNMIKLIENWYAINKSKSFWDNHDISDIPTELIKNIYLLKNARYISSTTSDLSNAFNKYKKLISKASKLKIILPIYSEIHFKLLIKLLKGEQLKSLELIISQRILNSIKRNNYFNKGLIKNNKVKITIIHRNLKVFLTCSNQFMSLSLFFKDKHYDDSQILIADDDKALDWASLLFDQFMEAKKMSHEINEKNIWDIDDKELLTLMVGREGGKTTSEIIDELLNEPKNKNQLSKKLKLDYNTITHHIKIMSNHNYVVEIKIENCYFYHPSDKLIKNLKEYYQIRKYLKKE